jgi:hypothetical protein
LIVAVGILPVIRMVRYADRAPGEPWGTTGPSPARS